jgi:hypothetical protein
MFVATVDAVEMLTIESREEGGLTHLRFTGIINEDSRLPQRVPDLAGKKLEIHLGGVARINSCGVRDWIRFIEQLESRGNAVQLVDCSPVVVAQVNMVRNFCGARGVVVSFYAPYYCSSCDRECLEPVTTAKVAQLTEPPAALCPKCGRPLEFDDLPESYFSFCRDHGARVAL